MHSNNHSIWCYSIVWLNRHCYRIYTFCQLFVYTNCCRFAPILKPQCFRKWMCVYIKWHWTTNPFSYSVSKVTIYFNVSLEFLCVLCMHLFFSLKLFQYILQSPRKKAEKFALNHRLMMPLLLMLFLFKSILTLNLNKIWIWVLCCSSFHLCVRWFHSLLAKRFFKRHTVNGS